MIESVHVYLLSTKLYVQSRITEIVLWLKHWVLNEEASDSGADILLNNLIFFSTDSTVYPSATEEDRQPPCLLRLARWASESGSSIAYDLGKKWPVYYLLLVILNILQFLLEYL